MSQSSLFDFDPEEAQSFADTAPPPADAVPMTFEEDEPSAAPPEAPVSVQAEPEAISPPPAPADLPSAPADFALFGRNLFGDAIEPPSRGKLSDQFVVPPFSVLDARSGYWQDRKRAWISLGIKSELGRGGNESDEYRYRDGGKKMRSADSNALGFSKAATIVRHGVGFDGSKHLRGEEEIEEEASGTSIFDPVIVELCCRWFCPPSGLVLDPFAGGSVRGIVSTLLERPYIGVDLSARQIAANKVQAERICQGLKPTWIVGDSATIDLDVPAGADMLLSCPPYGNLETYSDHPADISAMDHEDFLSCYRTIIARYCERLKADRFACFLVGDFRDEKGFYRNFISDTIAAFESAGLRFYNEAILVTAVGSLPIRVQKMFNATRKLGRTHQVLLVFVKGDPRRAAEACNGQLELPA